MQLSEVIVQEALGVVTSTKDFVVAQAPGLIQQILLWKSAECWFFIFLGVLFIISAVVMMKKFGAWQCTTEITPILEIASGTFIVMSVPSILVNAYTLMKIYVAPKIFLLEYLTSLLKSR